MPMYPYHSHHLLKFTQLYSVRIVYFLGPLRHTIRADPGVGTYPDNLQGLESVWVLTTT